MDSVSEQKNFTSCVLLDVVDGCIRSCTKTVNRPLSQLVGMWEVENMALDIVKNGKSNCIGVCGAHFQYD